MAATDPQSLTDIAEVSEKTASVSSIRSKASSKQPHTPQGSHRGANKQHKQMDDALVDLLGKPCKVTYLVVSCLLADIKDRTPNTQNG